MNEFNKRAEQVKATMEIANALLTNRQNNLEAVRAIKVDADRKIDISAANNIPGTLAKLGFAAGSKIGLIISLTSVCDTLKDKELNKQFLTDGKVDMDKMRKVFTNIGLGEVDGYTSVFSEEEYVNVTDKLNRKQSVLLACKERITEFAEKLDKLRSCRVEDLVTIGKDLEIIATVMSELEIDAAKDETKREGMIDISEFMNKSMKQKSKKFNIVNNFNDVVNLKRGYTKEEITKLSNEMDKTPSLFDLEDLVKAKVDEFYSTTDISKMETEELEEALAEIRQDALDECVILDPLAQIMGILLEAINTPLNEMAIKHYLKSSDMSLFDVFNISPQRDEDANEYKNETLEVAINHIKTLAVIGYEMLNNTFTYKNHMSMTKPEELAAMIRNIIYTSGVARGFSEQDIFYMAVDAGWYKRKHSSKLNKTVIIKSDRFKFRAVELVFGTELKCHFNYKAMATEADLEIPEELLEIEDLFEDGILMAFEDGQCDVELEDGQVYSILRLDNMEFNGDLVISIDEEGYVTFLENINPYEYETVDYFMFDAVSNLSKASSGMSPEELEALKEEAVTDKKAVANKFAQGKFNEFEKTFDMTEEELKRKAMVMEPALNQWENTIKFPVIAPESYRAIPKDGHMYITNSNNAARMMGKIKEARLGQRLSEYTDVLVSATSVGALVIVK